MQIAQLLRAVRRLCVPVYVCVRMCLCACVYLCVCVYCIGAEAAHAYLLVTHTQTAQRETDAETPAANFLIKDPLPLPFSTYIGFNPFPRLAPPNVTVQSLLPPPPASAQTPPAHCLSTSIFRPQWAPTVEPNNFWPIYNLHHHHHPLHHPHHHHHLCHHQQVCN